MKKRLAVMLIVVMVASMGLFAAKPEAQILQLKNQAAGMTAGEKMMFYESNKKSNILPFVLNFCLGAGVGSFVQGDTKGGVTGLIGDLAGCLLVGVGTGIMQQNAMAGELPGTLETLLIYGGCAVLTGFRIYECIRPFTFAKSYNNKLHEAIMGDASLTVLPVMGKDAPGVALVGSVRF